MNEFPNSATPDEDRADSHSATVQSVYVAAQILELLAKASRPQRVTDIAETLGMTKARVSRHLSTLSGRGFVTKMPDHGSYQVGPTLFRLASAAAEQHEIVQIADRHMVSLRNRIFEAMLLAVPADGDGVVVSALGSGRPLTPKLPRGVRLKIPVSPTAWVILAFSSPHIKERIFSRSRDDTPLRHDLPKPDAIRGRCETIASRFYDYHPDPHDAGFSVLSAPIFNHIEHLEGALAIVMIRQQGEDSTRIRFRGDLMRTTLDISRDLGSVRMADRLERSI